MSYYALIAIFHSFICIPKGTIGSEQTSCMFMFGSNNGVSDLGLWGKTGCYSGRAASIKKFVPICEKDISKYLKTVNRCFPV